MKTEVEEANNKAATDEKRTCDNDHSLTAAPLLPAIVKKQLLAAALDDDVMSSSYEAISINKSGSEGIHATG